MTLRNKPQPREKSRTRTPLKGGRMEKFWLSGNIFEKQGSFEDFAEESGRDSLTIENANRSFQKKFADQPFDGWAATGTASQTAVTMDRFGSSDFATLRRAVAGSITRIELVSDSARTAGELSVEAYIDGVATGLIVKLDSEETETDAIEAAVGENTYGINDPITFRITTDSAYEPEAGKVFIIVFLSE